MARRSDPSGQSWTTFARNHAPQIAAMDLFVVPTIGFDLLYALIIVRLVIVGSALEAPTVVAGLDDVTMLGQPRQRPPLRLVPRGPATRPNRFRSHALN
jgi:hypothetical protein